ncbi:MAG: aminopeptidase P family protein [Deltaproteobacteria bacterium]|nr:MAG: aminopeptidase P family protein [Deltaproteobacteria bacterium]
MLLPVTETAALCARRRGLHERLKGPALLAAGLPHSRNFRANHYPFRASSHFLYFVGRSIAGAALLFHEGRTTLFVVPPDAVDALWHGPRPTLAAMKDELGLDQVRPLTDIDEVIAPLRSSVATLPTHDAGSAVWLWDRLGRRVAYSSGDNLEGMDGELADAMIDLRLRHDDAALDQIRAATAATVDAQVAGMAATRPGGNERDVMAAIVGSLRHCGMADSFWPIVTVRGEVLHSTEHVNTIQDGDLVLADVGGETPEGWAADMTRCWPVSGRFSSTQRVLYNVVLTAQREAIAAVQPGHGYRLVHEAAKRATVSGLRDLGIFRGDVDGLLERGAASIFFPHGVGHLMGLDVHDMEDLGDRAGYAAGRRRSDRFGDAYLRLDRTLEPSMVVTIEPGFYQVPAIVGDQAYAGAVGADLDRTELAKYGDVRGIRIEDDVLVTAAGHEVLTRGAPKETAAIEVLMASQRSA